jgi:hypothetical protein
MKLKKMFLLDKGKIYRFLGALTVTRFGGPTIVGEWSIADTDCAVYVNAVGVGYLLLLSEF